MLQSCLYCKPINIKYILNKCTSLLLLAFVKPLNIFYLYQFEALVPQAPDVIYSSHNKKKYHQPNNTQDTHQRHLRFKTVTSAESFA